MNNGKVRIYELSKELNLDNKDILAVCEQLNIPVKSHSSTITETEAERIRSAAEKYSSTHHSSPSRPTASANSGVGGEPRKVVNRPDIKKQQILEIRKHPTPTNPKLQQPDAVGAPASQPASSGSAQSTFSQSTQSSMPLNAPNRPARPMSSDATSESEPELPVESPVTAESEPSETPSQPETPATPRQPEPKPQGTSSPPRMTQRPKLVGPPARPGESGEPANPQPTSGVTQAPIKRSRVERTERAEGAPTDAPSKPMPRTSPPQRPAAEGGGDSGGTRPPLRRRLTPPGAGQEDGGAPRSPAVLELRRPQLVRPNALREPGRDANAPGDTNGPGTAADGAVLDPDEANRLRRPTPARPAKRAKGWEEEDDEMRELAPKAGKVGVKAKRRSQPVIEDDFEEDLLDDDLDPEDTSMQVSLSLVRPAKPKPRPGQIRPIMAPTPAAPKAKKTTARDRRDRREQEAKVERPEKIVLTNSLTVQELATLLAVPETDIIKTLFLKGIAANINQVLDMATVTMVAEELDVEVETAEKESQARKVTEMLDANDLENLQPRPPVVTIMGHVDHGKTTLLDSIRKTKVAAGEAGGITQHIGAYHVDVEHAGQMQQVVFLDTPGHEAFTAMRARGARVTDIAILVVAADDGVQPQTIEAISHAKAAEVPLIVAINKIDKEGAQADRVKQELTEHGLVAEEWGGDTIMVPVSAIKGENLDALLEMILLVAEVEDLHANPDRLAKGTVIEAHLDKARGPVASLLVQNGTLRVGDVLVAGATVGKVRAMTDDRGQRVEEAGPSFAVEVLGLGDVPAAGDEFEVFQDEREAKAVAGLRADQQRLSRLQQQAMTARRVTLNSLSAKAQEGDLKELNLILKADVQGSVEAILGALQQLPQREVQIRVLLSAPGEITETDVDLAAASSAVILGFNTTFGAGARQAADQAGVDAREYNIIYKLLDDIQGAMEGLLEPEMVEEPLGQVEVRAVFPVGRGAVAGCYVLSGKISRNSNVRVHRNGNKIHEGILDSLKRMKEDVKEVNAGYECGIGMDSFNAWVEGDIIECFRMVSKRRTLSTN